MEWKSVKGYEGLYEVSESGQIRSVDRFITGKDGKTKKFKGKELFQSTSKKDEKNHLPRAYVQLWKNNKSKLILVHRIVAEAFVPNTSGKPCINHKDGNPLNNHYSNLEWCTYSENNKHAYENELKRKTRNFDQPTNKAVVGINKITGETLKFKSVHEAARQLNVSVMAVSNVVRANATRTDNKRACCGYVFEYDKCQTTIESTTKVGSE